jgi:hypothetical protein
VHFVQSAEDGALPVLAVCFDPSNENGDFWEPANRGNSVGPAAKSKCKLSSDPQNAKLPWKES